MLSYTFVFIGNIHGNEITGRQMLKKFLMELCRDLSSPTPPRTADNRRVIPLINTNTELHIIPSINPDGFDTRLSEKDCCQEYGKCEKGFRDKYTLGLFESDKSPDTLYRKHSIVQNQN